MKNEKLSIEQTKDSGMVITLILLLIGFITSDQSYIIYSLVVIIINMVFPKLFYPFALFWFGFSERLGNVMSKLILTLIFFIILLPVGIIKRLFSKDTLQLKIWKEGHGSVLEHRNHLFKAKDLEHTY